MIDRKFKILAVNPCNGKIYTEDNSLLLCAKDRATIPALKAYLTACEQMGCGTEHLESINLLIERVETYQIHVENRKPDTDMGCEIDRCIGGKTDVTMHSKD